MGQYVLLLVVALTVGAVVFGVTVLVSGSDPGLDVAEPDGRAVPLPASRPLIEADVSGVRFDTAVRGYRMAQVDQALNRAAYDIGYKDELISVLQAEVTALREGRASDADVLRKAREAALAPTGAEHAAEEASPEPEPDEAPGGVAEPDEAPGGVAEPDEAPAGVAEPEAINAEPEALNAGPAEPDKQAVPAQPAAVHNRAQPAADDTPSGPADADEPTAARVEPTKTGTDGAEAATAERR
jgi:DivIVA domain-containing protein